jgi:hypothetical protein
LARYDLHLSELEFWHLTGRQLSALIRRRKHEHERQQYLAGIIASTEANFSMRAPKEPLTAFDFMPCKRQEQERTDAEIAEEFAAKFQFIALPNGAVAPPIQ